MVLDEGTRDDDAHPDVDAPPDGQDDICDVEIGIGFDGVGETRTGAVIVHVGEDLSESSILCRTSFLPGEKHLHIVGVAGAGGIQSVLELDVSKLVALLVVDEDVHVRAGQLPRPVEDGGRRHAVELADLRRALQHLDAVLVCEARKDELGAE